MRWGEKKKKKQSGETDDKVRTLDEERREEGGEREEQIEISRLCLMERVMEGGRERDRQRCDK